MILAVRLALICACALFLAAAPLALADPCESHCGAACFARSATETVHAAPIKAAFGVVHHARSFGQRCVAPSRPSAIGPGRTIALTPVCSLRI